jgi:cytochrome c biogenesis protein CcdA
MTAVVAGVPLHAEPVVGPAYAAVLVLASLGSAALGGLALAAFARRRTSPYLFVALAVAALAARSAIGWLGMVGGLSATTHHTVEHGLDVVMVALVVAAVWYARSVRPATTP